METVIFACVHNAGRSQMAAALFNAMANPARVQAISAGTQPAGRIHAVVVEAMAEIGIDISSNRPQKLTAELVQGATMLVTMGCGDQCPSAPGLLREDWPLPDPTDLPLIEVREIRDDIRARIVALMTARHWTKPVSSLNAASPSVAPTNTVR